MGESYEKGVGTAENNLKAEEYYQRAANHGLLSAQFTLGRLQYRLGREAEGIENLEKAASLDDYDALVFLGRGYSKSEDLETIKKAIDCFQRASELNKNNGDALSRLGWLYCFKEPIKDFRKAVEYFNEAIKLGSLRAMRDLGMCYVNGWGVDQDDFMGFSWTSKAVAGGYKLALNELGEFYRFGIGTKKDPLKAIDCYKEFIESTNNIIGAVNIGEMFFYGEGVGIDYDEATKWLQMACDSSFAQPYVLIGRMYEMGVYGEKDISQAISWYKKAEQLGSPIAEYYMGLCYANDEILPDTAKAIEYYTKASDAGLMDAKLELAKCCQQGIGIEQDKEQAFSLYHEIANRWLEMRQAIGSYVFLAEDKGGTVTNNRQCELKKPLYSEAMFNLGKCYIDGVGTDVRISDGVKWITIAAKLGNEEAEKFNLSETFQKESMKRSE